MDCTAALDQLQSLGSSSSDEAASAVKVSVKLLSRRACAHTELNELDRAAADLHEVRIAQASRILSPSMQLTCLA